MPDTKSTRDPKFDITYNFNDIKTLVFSDGSTLGSLSSESAISLNPSIDSSVNQNTIKISYTEGRITKEMTATINKISIMRDITKNDITSYAVALQGNILTKVNYSVYIIIPFKYALSNNSTHNSMAIEKIVSFASKQIYEGVANTILSESVALNDLIENNVDYIYSMKPKFKNDTNANTFIIYKQNVGVITNNYIAYLRQFNNGAFNNITDLSNFMINKLTPDLKRNTVTSEIMIDCAPISMTPGGQDEENVMFTKMDDIYGKGGKTTNETIVASFFLIFFAVFFIIIMYMVAKSWSSYFLNNSDIPSTPAPV
jgi:hypothetical protein